MLAHPVGSASGKEKGQSCMGKRCGSDLEKAQYVPVRDGEVQNPTDPEM